MCDLLSVHGCALNFDLNLRSAGPDTFGHDVLPDIQTQPDALSHPQNRDNHFPSLHLILAVRLFYIIVNLSGWKEEKLSTDQMTKPSSAQIRQHPEYTVRPKLRLPFFEFKTSYVPTFSFNCLYLLKLLES